MISIRFIFSLALAGTLTVATTSVAQTKTAEFTSARQNALQVSQGALEFRVTRDGVISKFRKRIPSHGKAQIKLDKGETVTKVQLAELRDGDLLLAIVSD